MSAFLAPTPNALVVRSLRITVIVGAFVLVVLWFTPSVSGASSSAAARVSSAFGVVMAAVLLSGAVSVILALLIAIFGGRFGPWVHRCYVPAVVLAGLLLLLAELPPPEVKADKSKSTALSPTDLVQRLRPALSSVLSALNLGDGGKPTPPGALKPQPATISPVSQETSDDNHLVGIIRGFSEEASSLRAAYDAELKAEWVTDLMSPERLSQDLDLEETLAIRDDALEIVKRYRGRVETLLSDLPARIDAQGRDTLSKRLVGKGVHWVLDSYGPLIKKNWELEENRIQCLSEFVDLLTRTSGNWQVASGQIQFDKSPDLAQFNSVAEKIDEIAKQQAAIQEQLRSTSGSAVDMLREAILK